MNSAASDTSQNESQTTGTIKARTSATRFRAPTPPTLEEAENLMKTMLVESTKEVHSPVVISTGVVEPVIISTPAALSPGLGVESKSTARKKSQKKSPG